MEISIMVVRRIFALLWSAVVAIAVAVVVVVVVV